MNVSIKCPVHKNEELHFLFFFKVIRVKSGGNKYGRTSKSVKTNLLYCQKCKKARKVKGKIGV